MKQFENVILDHELEVPNKLSDGTIENVILHVGDTFVYEQQILDGHHATTYFNIKKIMRTGSRSGIAINIGLSRDGVNYERSDAFDMDLFRALCNHTFTRRLTKI